MTARHPQRLCDALPAVLAVWQDETGRTPPAAVFCAAEDSNGDLCRRIQCDGRHEPDRGGTRNDPKETR